MSFSKVMMFFSDGKYGWSETYHLSTVNLKPNDALSASLPLVKARAAMLATGLTTCESFFAGSVPSLDWVRVSTVGQPRNTIFWSPRGANAIAGVTAIPPGAAQFLSAKALQLIAPDNPYSAMLMSCTLTNGGVSRRPLSGVPDPFVCDQASNPSSPFIGAWQKFASVLTSGKYGAISYQGVTGNNAAYQPPPNPPWIQIDGMTQDAEGRPTLSLASPLVLPTDINCCNGFHVTISCYHQLNNTPVLNGNHRALPVASVSNNFSQVTLYKTFKPLQSWCLGYLALYQPTVYPFVSAVLQRPVKRNRGRPFGLARGRRRVIR